MLPNEEATEYQIKTSIIASRTPALTFTSTVPLPTSTFPKPPYEIIHRTKVHIPDGSFEMGCDPNNNIGITCEHEFSIMNLLSELPQHKVMLSAFTIDKFEVTNYEYSLCVSAGICNPPRSVSSNSRRHYYDTSDYANFPVIYVSWYQASTFCIWAGGRLPSEAEWEKAARGSLDTRVFPWGNNEPNCSKVNYYDGEKSCLGDTSKVGKLQLGNSYYGVSDLSGNVAEWINDWFSNKYYSISPEIDPRGPENGIDKVIRGGSWSDDYFRIRVTYRAFSNPDSSGDTVGFRCAYK